MNAGFSRRTLIQAAGAAALPIPAATTGLGSRSEVAGLPKICLEIGASRLAASILDDSGARRVKQLGVDHVITGYPGKIPWQETRLRELVDRLKGFGLTLGNIMIMGFPKTIYGRAGRDEEIQNIIESIKAAGKVGLRVIEYNFYAHRLTEGYYEEIGRAGAGMTAFDYDRVRDLPPLEQEGVHSLDEMWSNITYFLKAVIPVAE
jgi:mannonate dehydratase